MRFLATLLAFSSLNAFACPDLSGTYAACRSSNGTMSESTDMVVTQKTESGITIYSVTSTDSDTQERNTDEMVADGITRSETTTDTQFGEVTASMTFACSGPKVTGNISVTAGGSSLMEINQEIQKNGSALEMDYTGSIFGMEFSDTLICE